MKHSELMRLYPAEIVEAPEANPHEVFDTLRDWWEYKEYTILMRESGKRYAVSRNMLSRESKS